MLAPHGARVLARFGWDGPVTVPDHLRQLDRLAAAVVHDAWELAEVGGDLLIDEAITADDLGATLGLHGFEVEAAVAGPAPDPAHFLRRPGLTEEERRAELLAARRSS